MPNTTHCGRTVMSEAAFLRVLRVFAIALYFISL